MIDTVLRKQLNLCNKRETKEGHPYHYCYEECPFEDDPYVCQIPKFITYALNLIVSTKQRTEVDK